MKIRPKAKRPSRGSDEGWAALSTLISGFVVFGGIGWLLDRWWGTHLMVPIGLIVGMALGIYAVVAQFGRSETTHEKATQEKAWSAVGAGESVDARHAVNAAAALRAEKTANRVKRAQRIDEYSPNDGPPPAGDRRETKCL
jgi:F0F1-type ATP synthase assembly protein I